MGIFDFLKKKSVTKKYGWIADLPDGRDQQMDVLPALTLPKSVDLRPFCPPVYDQGQLGSCTAHAVAGACHTDERIAKKHDFIPARLFIYYNTRLLEGNVGYDSGATIRGAIKSLVTYGYCDEKLYPYKISKFKSKPGTNVYTAATSHKLTGVQYQRVNQSRNGIGVCIAQKRPVVFGFTVYESFESDIVTSTGMMPMPTKGERVLGGHAVTIVGYDNDKQHYIVRNSYGPNWGAGGYFFMKYEFAHNPNYCTDFWTIMATN